MDEFDLIRRYFTPANRGERVVRGPGDDAALVAPTPGRQLVATTDTLVEDRHFPADLGPADIGWRALAANLSDLAAMGAEPRWCLLALTLPAADEHWLAGFSAGFFELAGDTNIQLIGGDINQGPLSITVQALGEVEPGQALRRGSASPGDRIRVGGVPGEAAAGLQLWWRGERSGPLVERFRRPRPRMELGRALRGRATACIDISDGLLADLAHLLAPGQGARVEVANLPVSGALEDWPEAERLGLQCGGGDDYLLLFTEPDGQELSDGCYDLGPVTADGGIQLVDAGGHELPSVDPGWKHFH